MSILDLHAPEIEQAASNVPYRAPPEPEAKFSAWKAVTAIPRGVAEAGAQVAATGADVANALRYMRDATPEQRKEIDRGGVPVEQFSSQTGDRLRRAGEDFRPDPVTAHAAEQVVYGFARGATKVVAGAVTGGPAGVAAAGLEEAITQADELRRKGVGVQARSEAGLVQGVGLGLAALPLVGQTAAGTAALYAIGGPGGFMAQQAITRDILRSAGHDRLAEQFDPFDPVGLAVSALVPAVFTAAGIRSQRAAKAAKAAQDFRAGPVPSETTPVAAAVADAYRVPAEHVDAAMVHNLTLARVDTEARAQAVGEVRPLESLAAFTDRGGFKPPEPPKVDKGPDPFLAWVKAQGGIDIGEKLDITGEANGVRANPAGIFRRGGITSDDLASRAAAEGYLLPDQAGDSGALVDLVKRAVNGERVLNIEQQGQKAARDYADAQTQVRVAELEQRLELLGVDPKAARGNPDAMEAYLREHEGALFRAAVDELATAGRGGDGLQAAADDLRYRAEQVVRDMQDGGRTLAEYEAEVQPLSPVMRRKVQELEKAPDAPTRPQAPNPEAATPARGPGDAPAAAGAAEPGRAGAGVQADGVTPGEKAADAAVQSRLAQIEAERPDLQVMLDGMDKPMALADFLAAVKADADEMLADAPLLQVAAECALLNGS